MVVTDPESSEKPDDEGDRPAFKKVEERKSRGNESHKCKCKTAGQKWYGKAPPHTHTPHTHSHTHTHTHTHTLGARIICPVLISNYI